MALLKDLIVTGASRFIGDAYMNTIKSGTWEGTPIALSKGGTAGTTTANQVLISTTTSGTSLWTALSNLSVGSATAANTVKTITKTDSSATNYYLSFVDSNNSSATAETVYTNANLKYENKDGNLQSTKFNGLTLTAAAAGFTIAGGTTSKTLTVGADYTLAAACAKAVDTSIAANSTSTNLPTSLAVESRINAHSGIDKVGTVTSITPGSGLRSDNALTSLTAITSSGTLYLMHARDNELGGIMLYNVPNSSAVTTATASTTSDRYYAVEIDKDHKAYVNIPWTNVNSSYATKSFCDIDVYLTPSAASATAVTLAGKEDKLTLKASKGIEYAVSGKLITISSDHTRNTIDLATKASKSLIKSSWTDNDNSIFLTSNGGSDGTALTTGTYAIYIEDRSYLKGQDKPDDSGKYTADGTPNYYSGVFVCAGGATNGRLDEIALHSSMATNADTDSPTRIFVATEISGTSGKHCLRFSSQDKSAANHYLTVKVNRLI